MFVLLQRRFFYAAACCLVLTTCFPGIGKAQMNDSQPATLEHTDFPSNSSLEHFGGKVQYVSYRNKELKRGREQDAHDGSKKNDNMTIVVEDQEFYITPNTRFVDLENNEIDKKIIKKGDIVSFSYYEDNIVELQVENRSGMGTLAAGQLSCGAKKKLEKIIYENGVYKNVPQ